MINVGTIALHPVVYTRGSTGTSTSRMAKTSAMRSTNLRSVSLMMRRSMSLSVSITPGQRSKDEYLCWVVAFSNLLNSLP